MIPVTARDTRTLYFWAIVAEGHAQTELTRLKQLASNQFGCHHALRSPAHITLIPPIRLTAAKCDELTPAIRQVAERIQPFQVRLKGINGFAPRVVYVDVQPCNQLDQLQERLLAAFDLHDLIKNDSLNPFRPHVTLAFRDLHEDQYDVVLEFFRGMEICFDWSVFRLSRLHYHMDGWKIDQYWTLGTS